MKDQRDNGELHRADPAYRRRMQVLLAITVVLGLAVLAALYFWLERQGSRVSAGDLFGYERSLRQALAGLCIVLGLAAAAFALWLYRLANATRAERRWPPSHMRTSSDMRIRYLTSADLLVVQMKLGAFALALAALALVAWAAWLLRTA